MRSINSTLALIDTFEAYKRLITEALASTSRHNHPVYDMMYAILARRYGSSILSMDKRLIAMLQKIDIELA